jgi:hypothetical protein
MKNKLLTIILLFLVYTKKGQTTVQIVPGNSQIEYYPIKTGNPNSIERKVNLRVAHFGATINDLKINFKITNISKDSLVSLDMKEPNSIIKKESVTLVPDTIDIPVYIRLNANEFKLPEYFDIEFAKTDSVNKGKHRVFIVKEIPLNKIDTTKKIDEEEIKIKKQEKDWITFINAANFDFDKNTNTNYVAVFNVLAKEITKLGKCKRNWLGLNIGAMKINYSLNGDSINTQYNTIENALMNPLDSTKAGGKYLRQYNQVNNTAKNLAFSFYCQPLIQLSYQDNFNLFLHGHFEILVNRWTFNLTINNIQQDTGIFTTNPVQISTINKFSKSTTETFSQTTNLTNLSYYYGGGFTALIKPWKTTHIYIQPTWGKIINYVNPYSISTRNLQLREYSGNTDMFYLFRINLRQKITNNIDGVMGADLRGVIPKKGFAAQSPNYCAFIGLNIGLDGIKKLIE